MIGNKSVLAIKSDSGKINAHILDNKDVLVRLNTFIELEKNQMVAIARTKKFLTAVEWLPGGDRICLWHTSKYLRGGEYRPAKTKGWVVKIN